MRPITLVLVLFISIPAFTQTKKATANETWQTLTDPKYSVQYPAEWQLSTNAYGTTFMIFLRSEEEQKFRENINLITQDLTGQNFDLDKFVKLSEEQIKTMVVDGVLVESRRIRTNAGEHHLIVYTGSYEGRPLKWKQYYWVAKDHAYLLTFTSAQDTYDSLIEVVNKVMDSFELKNR